MSKDPKSAVSRESDKFMLRFPDGMRGQIAESAKRNGRSMNSEIILALHDYYMRQDFHEKLVDSADLHLSGERLGTEELDKLAAQMKPDPHVAGAFADLVLQRLSETLIFEVKPFTPGGEDRPGQEKEIFVSAPVGTGKTSSYLRMIPHVVLRDADFPPTEKQESPPVPKPDKRGTSAKDGSAVKRKSIRNTSK
ncbi:Arc family DNA-binding protein [Pseudoduganella sp. FT26W]|uniref:Arc family DNA-binding protein n=1 Tax=Duganella aquatilis TaxID=2666082 RepID=A0A844D369_9BURK|nr:Arc family DNA-binding protein [Duganella aquatilis]MRW85381.1 Arc family DNA-binding protein [Duganella aquatilis]